MKRSNFIKNYIENGSIEFIPGSQKEVSKDAECVFYVNIHHETFYIEASSNSPNPLWIMTEYFSPFDNSRNGFELKAGDTIKFGPKKFTILELHNLVNETRTLLPQLYV